VHAQGLKDLAYYAQNGFGGVPKDHTVALELFKQSADLGNVQSKVDMLYLQHYGLDGIHADKAASASAMKSLASHSHRATEFVKDWHAAGKAVVPTQFNSGTILQGMKVGCTA
jgi:TPR repeat protein